VDTQVEHEITKVVRASLAASKFECSDRSETCMYCQGTGEGMPPWYDPGVVGGVSGFCIASALEGMRRHNYHQAELYLIAAEEFALKAAEAWTAATGETMDPAQVATFMDELTRP
jgi:hypothetical protein